MNDGRYVAPTYPLEDLFQRLLTGAEKGYAATAWQELASRAHQFYTSRCNGDPCPDDCVPCASDNPYRWCDDCRAYAAEAAR